MIQYFNDHGPGIRTSKWLVYYDTTYAEVKFCEYDGNGGKWKTLAGQGVCLGIMVTLAFLFIVAVEGAAMWWASIK